MDRSKRLGEESIPRLLLTFSAPAIVGMLAQALYNIVDRIFVGQAIGPDGIAGATVAFPFMLILLACGMLVGFGSAASISIRLGQRKKDDAERVLGNAIVLLLGLSCLMTVVGVVWLDPLLRLFGSSAKILPFARDYMGILAMGAVFQIVSFGLNAMIRGEGNPRMAMTTMLIGALTNTILDPIFLFGFGWGMRGAAAATVIAQIVATLWVLRYFLRGKSLLKFRAKNLRLRRATCLTIIAIGSPMFSMQIASSMLNAIMNNQLHKYGGDLAISAMGIVYAVTLFIVMPVFGINQGAQPIIGYNHGAGKPDRVKKTLLMAMLGATGITVAGFIVVMLFPSQVVGLFHREDDELLRMGTHALRICLMMLPLIGFQIVGASYFQAVGKPKHAMFLGLSRQILLLVPAVLILPRFFDLDGLWAAIPAADLGSCLLTGTWLLVEVRHLREKHARENGTGSL